MEKSVAKNVVAKKVTKKTVAKKVAAQAGSTKTVSALSAYAGYERVWNDFLKNSGNLPASRKSLQSKIGHLIAADADGEEVAHVIKRLEDAAVLVFSENDRPKYSF